MFIEVAHDKFKRVDAGVFTKTVVADCMTHTCTMHATGKQKLEACCQYGCDVDLYEQQEILQHAGDIRAVLDADAPAVWFREERELDPDTKSGAFVRTVRHNDGCVFLSHDQRGCAIHRAALAHGWSWRHVKPGVCQLFPLTYTSDAIVISDDYTDYSCAYTQGAPSLYRVSRDALAHVFGDALVAALDDAEARVLARRLPLA